MIGAIIGDIIGSRFEFHNIKTKDFELFADKCCFTDDTILTCAVADTIMNNIPPKEALRKWGLLYQSRTYENGTVAPFGKGFMNWLQNGEDYKSATNGCVMRISPIGLKYDNLKEATDKALEFTYITHNHPESINATKAYIETMLMVKKGIPDELIKNKIATKYNYNLSQTVDEIRPNYNRFYCTCRNSVPQAIICALDASSYEEAIRNAISLGGDSDTLACMAGGIAEAKYEIPQQLKEKAMNYLDRPMQDLLNKFYSNQDKIKANQLTNIYRSLQNSFNL